MDKLSLEFLTERLEHLETKGLKNTEKEKSYLDTYPAMLRHVANTTFDKDSLLTTALMVYGWMPTIPVFDKDHKLEKDHIKDLSNRLNQLKADGMALDEKELKQLKEFLNNSVVGASKLLHFIRPDIYPIWDSRVSVNIGGKKHGHHVNNARRYMEYKGKMSEIVREKEFADLRNRMIRMLEVNDIDSSSWTDMRVAEFILFN